VAPEGAARPVARVRGLKPLIVRGPSERVALDLGLAVAVIMMLDILAVAVITLLELSGGREFVLMWEEESPIRPLLVGSVIVFLAALLSLWEVPLTPAGDVRVNVGGAVVPLVAAAFVLVRSRPKVRRFLVSLAVATATSLGAGALGGVRFGLSLAGFAVVAVVTAAACLGLARWKFREAAVLAYTAPTLGVFLGVDAAGLVLLGGTAPIGVTLGAQGILDIIFLAGIAGLVIVWALSSLRILVRRVRDASRPAA